MIHTVLGEIDPDQLGPCLPHEHVVFGPENGPTWSGEFDRAQVINYCGGGIAASADALALVMLGHPDVRLYDASMSEWSNDPGLPMETGE